MSFILSNWYLFLLVIVSATLLFVPSFLKGGKAGISAAEAVQKINREKAVVVDVRTEQEFAAGHIKGSKNIQLDSLKEKAPSTIKNKNNPVILVCDKSLRAQKAAPVLQALGHQNVFVLSGGISAWKAAALPLVTDSKTSKA